MRFSIDRYEFNSPGMLVKVELVSSIEYCRYTPLRRKGSFPSMVMMFDAELNPLSAGTYFINCTYLIGTEQNVFSTY